MSVRDEDMKRAAVIGIRHEIQRLTRLAEILERELGTAAHRAAVKPRPKRRRLSAAGRANIVAALKKRWAEARKQGGRATDKRTRT